MTMQVYSQNPIPVPKRNRPATNVNRNKKTTNSNPGSSISSKTGKSVNSGKSKEVRDKGKDIPETTNVIIRRTEMEDDSESNKGEVDIDKINTGDNIFVAVEQQAEFPGGQAALGKWLSSNIRYPQEAAASDIQGRVHVKFVVEKDGSVTRGEIIKSPHESLSNEVLRLINKMPKWSPGRNNGVTVRCYYYLPVTFRLQNE